MQIKKILSTLGIMLLSSVALAEQKNECEELEKYLEDNVQDYRRICDDYDQDVLDICVVNDKGEVKQLRIENTMLNEEQTNHVLSYNKALIDLFYKVDFGKHSKYFEFPSIISKITTLEKLRLSGKSTINKGIINGSKGLKHLTLRNTQLYKYNIDEIASLTNLNELVLQECEILDNSDLKSLSALKNLTKLELIGSDEDAEKITRFDNAFNNVKKLKIDSYIFTQNFINDISTMTNIEELSIRYSRMGKEIDYSPLKKLTKLRSLYIYNSVNEGAKIEFPTSLKKFTMEYGHINQDFIDEVGKITNLEELQINDPTINYALNFDSFKNLSKLTNLQLTYFLTEEGFLNSEFKKFPDSICTLKNLKILNLHSNNIHDLPEEISNLTNLESLDLSFNRKMNGNLEPLANLKKLKNLDLSLNEFNQSLEPLSNLKYLENLYLKRNNFTSIPESFNNLSNLKVITFTDNQNIEGKALTNKNLETCSYGSDYYSKYIPKICLPKNANTECLSYREVDDYKPCSSSDNDNDNKDKVSTNGRCGINDGKCPNNECCSEYGYCGRSEKHCGTGCQSEFGQCGTSSAPSLPTSTNGKCGSKDGKCPNNECCSKYGYCGTSDKYCGTGCQSEFGQCGTSSAPSLPTSTNGRCGSKDGKCPNNECCSKYGYCGRSEKHCGTGCQSEFGQCGTSSTPSLPTSTNGRCGSKDGKCPKNQCCSKYGYCGTSDKYCGNGCQSEFGKCN